MTDSFKIQDNILNIDTNKTRDFYLTENKIVDDCTCDDCRFYSTVFIQEPLEIFKHLLLMGADLSKNLKSEPTGVWCIRDDNDRFVYCQQIYQLIGHILTIDKSPAKYFKIENGYKISAVFTQKETDAIDVEITIEWLNE